jgi:hypothetical protein
VLVELCQLHGEFFQHDILFHQEHEASPHNNVVQVHLDYWILHVMFEGH